MKRRLAFLAAAALLLFIVTLGRPSSRTPALRPVRPDLVKVADRPSGAAGSTVGFLPDAAIADPLPQARPGLEEKTSELLIFLKPGTDPRTFARSLGVKLKQTLVGSPHIHVFEAATPEAAVTLRDQAETDPRVTGAYLNERTHYVHCVWTPLDPLFADASPTHHGQWHHGNGASPNHANLAGAWNRDVTGQGIIIGIVDDCLEKNHPDLFPNFVAADSWNWGNSTNDPSPNPAYDGTPNEDAHGTSTSGVAAARGGNGIGVTGAAPLAGLAGLRIDWPTQTTSMFVNATLYHSSGPNTNVKVKSHSYGYTSPYVANPAESQAVTDSTTAGTIHCFAAGNNRVDQALNPMPARDSNTTMPQNNPNSVTVAALGSNGKFSYYSSFGANVFVTAPSNGVSGFGIMTTDRMGEFGYNFTGATDITDKDYTRTFGGTSSATPLTAGILTLGKQVRPNLSLRFAKHALARSCVQVDALDNTVIGGGDGVTAGSAWKTNAAGFKFNQNYGFGLIDAGAFIQKLYEIDGVTAGATLSVATTSVAAGIPDNNPTGISRTFTLPVGEPLEEIQVTLNVSHNRRGQLEGYLTSPSGTIGRLFSRGPETTPTGSGFNWTFTTNQFWGEPPAGTWTLKLVDTSNPTSGNWNSYAINARTGTILSNTTAPSVSSIVRLSANPSNAGSVSYLVTFSEPVTGVDATDFALTTTGTLAGTSITGVTGSFCVYTVTVNTGSGDGTLRLDVVDNDTIQDSLANSLGGAGAGNGSFTTGQIYTIDKTAPTVTINQAVAQADPTNGASILFTVVFNETVTGFATGDVTLSGTAGATTATVSGPGPTYTVTVTGMTGSGTVIASIAAGVATDSAGNANAASTSTDNTVTRDVAQPTVTINQAVGQVDPTNGSPILFTVVFNETVTGFATGDVTLSGTAGATTATVSGAGPTYTVSVSGMTGSGTVIASIAAGVATDAAGNGNAASTSSDNTVTYDITSPTVTINQAVAQADPTNGASILFTVVFSETVTGFATGDVTLSGTAGATTATVSGPGPTYTVTVTGMTGSGTVIASIAAGVATDGVGNGNAASTSTDNTVTRDITSPTVTINQAGGQADPTNASPILFTVVFNETVTGFATGDVTLSGTAGATTATVSGPGPTYTVTVTGMTGTGTVIASIGAGVATDSAGNGNGASTSTDNTVTYDLTQPTVTINQAVAQADPTNASPILFTVVFSEAVTGFATGDVTLSGTAGATTATVSGPGPTYTVTVTGMTGSGTVIASIAAGVATSTATSNPNQASTSTDNTVTYDITPPTVTINQAVAQTDPTNGGSILFTVVFNGPVTGFATGDVTLGGTAGATTAIVSGAGPTYTVTVSGMTSSGTVTASVAAGVATDAVGNGNAASTSTDNTVTYDITPPTVTINQAVAQVDPTNGASIVFTVVFSETVTGFATGDVTLSGTAGATTATVSGPGPTYTVTVTGMTGSGTVIASIAAGVATDAVGNGNTASTSTDNTVTRDVAQPTVTINQAVAQADPTNGASILFTVVFNETVTGFATGDVTLSGTAGATTATVSGPGPTYTVTVTGMTGSGTVIASIAAGVATDAVGNGNAASTSTDNTVTYDITSPTVTINQAVAQADPTSASPILFTVVFNETVTGFATGDVTLSGTAGATTATVSGPGPTYTVTVSGMTSSGTVTASIGAGVAVDSVGNGNAASTSSDNTVTYTLAQPTVTINQAVAQADPTNVASVVFTVVFNEAVNGFATGDVTLSGTAGATTATVSGAGPTYTVTVTGMTGNGTVIASIPAGVATSAATSNPNLASTSTDNTVTYDTVSPTVTIDQAVAQADPTNGASIVFTVVFSETVIGFATGDVTLSGTAGATTATVSGPGPSYTVTVTGMTGSGTVIASIAAGVATDGAGNANAGSTSSDNTVTRDVAQPTVMINQAVAQVDPTNGASIVFTVVFNETVTGFATGDVTLSGTAGATTATVSGPGPTYTVTVTGMTGSGTVIASIAAGVATDSAGNANAASTSTDNTVTVDVTSPAVTINQAVAQADPTNGASILFTVVFSETVTGFATGDVTLSGTAGATTATVSGPGPTYTVTVSGMTGNGTVVASIAAGVATDAVGNGNAASTSSDNTVTYDNTPPTVTINQAVAQVDPTNASPILFTVVFSEAVTGFATGDITLSGTAGATTATVSGPGPTYTVTVSGMTGSGTVIASIAAGVAVDGSGNGNAASTSTDNTVTYDITPPAVTINQAVAQLDPTNASPILFTVVFSETVTGFATGDVTLSGTAGATTATVSGPGPTYTVTVSGMTGNGTVIASIAAGVATDAVGNANAASTSTDNSVTYDATAPVVSQVTSTTANGIYGTGNPIAVTIVFSETVNVTGTPRLTLETGAADAVVNYSSGSGTNTLLFTYTIAAGHVSVDLDYASAAALALNGGTIRDAAGNNATLTLAAPGAPGSLGANKNLIVDTTPPVTGAVNDGWIPPDVDAQVSVTTLSANWSGFSDPESGITGYEWAIGTSPGGQQILAFLPVGLQTSASTSAIDLVLSLTNVPTYYVTVRATNGAGLTSVMTSDGVTVSGTGTGPAPPAALYAIASDQAVILEWLPSPSVTTSFYRVWWKPAASPWTAAVRVDPLAGLTATIPGLVNGTPYDFMIKAVDGSENESAGAFASATPLPLITIGGAGDYFTIQDGLDAALPGDTVWVGPGTFSGALILPPGVSLIGVSPIHTIITGSPGSTVITVQGAFPTDPTSTIGNLTVTTGTVGVDAGTADVYLHHVIIHDVSSHGAFSAAGGRLRVVNCTIMSNGGDGIFAQGTAEARNCIVGRNIGAGLNLPAGALVNYNDVYKNAPNYSTAPGGTGNVTSTAVFLDEPFNVYIEDSTSPTVDTGDPADAFSQERSPNGARINQGAFGNTRWAASKSGKARRHGGGGGCGLLGLDGLALVALLFLRNRRRS